jgi:hypothetical protein
MQHKSVIVLMVALTAMIAGAHEAWAEPTADEVLAATDFSSADKQRIMAGEMVSGDLRAVSERDLSLSLAFIVKTSPDDLAKEVLSGALSKSDDQLTARGNLSQPGIAADFAGVKLVPGGSAVAKAYISASGGDKLNLSTEEIAAFNALKSQSDPTNAVEQQLRTMLLARYQAYRSSGLAGIKPYDRGGKSSDPAADLRKASEAPVLKKFFPAVQKVLAGYPQATVPGLKENFFWVNNKIDDLPTYAVTHIVLAPEGTSRIVIQRQFYVGRSYNAEQAIAGFFPVQQGTLVVYANHTFTDQVSGFGSSTKQSIGRRVMGSTLKKLFEKSRAAAAKP